MISLSRIVKSMAVVDDRPQGQDAMRPRMELELAGRTVLKSGAMNAFGIQFNDNIHPLTRDAYLGEINRLRIEAEEAGAELRKIRREIEEARAQAEAEAETLFKEADKSILDDEIFGARQQELRDMVAQTEARVAELIESANVEAEEIREQARAVGYAEGLDKGYEEARDSFNEEAGIKIGEISEIIMALTGYGPELMQKKELEFVELTVAIAEKVIGREIKADPKYILDMLKESVQKNHRENYITITLSPDMLPLKMSATEEITSLIEEMASNISVYVEKEAGEGVCVMETPKGVTDMSVGTQLENIKESLREHV